MTKLSKIGIRSLLFLLRYVLEKKHYKEKKEK